MSDIVSLLRRDADATDSGPAAILWRDAADTIERMTTALTSAAETFRFYEAEHAKKAAGFLDYGDKESARASAGKADTNRQRAEMCEAAIGTSPKPPIPSGVYYRAEADNFYDVTANVGMGMAFWTEWRARKHEFPTEPGASS